MSSKPARKINVDIKVGETILFSTGVDSTQISLTLLQKTGQLARVQVEAPDDVWIGGTPLKRDRPQG